MSNFRPDTGGRRSSLVQALSSSRAAGREGRCRQMSLACVGRTCSVPTTRFAPARGACFPRLRCSGSRLLSRERALHGVWFQCSGSPQTRGLGWACVLCLPRRAAQAARSFPGALSPGAARLLPSVAPASVSGRTSQVRLVSVLGSWSLAATLPADVNHPESQEVFG